VARKIIVVCDVCGSEQDVKRFTLSGGGQTVRPELCAEHAAPLAALLRKPAAKRAPAKAA
jgi:hypothetical protein